MATRTRKSTCIHHWLINENHKGVCKKCEARRDFNPQRLMSEFLSTVPAHTPFNASKFLEGFSFNLGKYIKN